MTDDNEDMERLFAYLLSFVNLIYLVFCCFAIACVLRLAIDIVDRYQQILSEYRQKMQNLATQRMEIESAKLDLRRKRIELGLAAEE